MEMSPETIRALLDAFERSDWREMVVEVGEDGGLACGFAAGVGEGGEAVEGGDVGGDGIGGGPGDEVGEAEAALEGEGLEVGVEGEQVGEEVAVGGGEGLEEDGFHSGHSTGCERYVKRSGDFVRILFKSCSLR